MNTTSGFFRQISYSFVQRLFVAALAVTLCSRVATGAAIPSPEKLLPDDTLVVVTAPDFAKVRELYASSPQTQLWNDPSMRRFKDHFQGKLKQELLQPLERELGVRFDQYTNLVQGQLTVALTQKKQPGASEAAPALLLLADTKEQSNQLKTNLADLRRKWTDAGKSLRAETVRNIEFLVVPVSEKDVPKALQKFFPTSNEPGTGANGSGSNSEPASELVIGQVDSLLIAGTSLQAVEKVAVRLTGGAMPALGDKADYESCHLAMFRDAPFYGWVNVKAFVDMVLQNRNRSSENENPFAVFTVDKLFTATGLSGVRSFAFSVRSSIEGTSAECFIGVPESNRKGLFKLFPSEEKESGPPPFVPADAVKFQRWRIDGTKGWATLEKVFNDISPQLLGTLNFILDTAAAAAKEKDPGFDLKKNLFGNLGDDMISYEKPAKGSTARELASPPSLFLVSSPRPEQFTAAVQSILALMTREKPAEREFLGRKIFSLPLPASPLPMSDPSKSAGRTLLYAGTSSYVAFSTDASMLEEFLRNSDGTGKALRETAGLVEANAKVGGSRTGWYGYENQVETTRSVFEALKNGGNNSGAEKMLAPGFPAYAPSNGLNEWFDFSLLPPFDSVSRYFHYTVYAGSANVDGFTFRFFSPTPPALRK